MPHDIFLHEALALAERWQGECAPNPSVGAVVVQAGKVIATGWHKGVGTPHAEQMALAQVKNEKALTLYVTLEPCNHWGRTPPCTDLIIQHAGVTRVVYAFVDPNPMVAENDSKALLSAKGIQVLYHPLSEITAFYAPYAYWVKTRLPFVHVKLALSLDGKIAGACGQPVDLSNSKASEFTHTHRSKCDVILTTAQTILADNPALNVRLKDQEKAKKIAILDRTLILTHQEKVFQKNSHSPRHPEPLHGEGSPLDAGDPSSHKVGLGMTAAFMIFYDKNLTVTSPRPQCQYIPIEAKTSALDLRAILSALGEAGMHQVWVEAGGRLFTALHCQGLVSRTYLYITPHVLGCEAVDAFQDKTVFQRQHSVSCNTLDDNALLILDWKCLPGSLNK